jgi:hypothetical protein
MLTVLKGFTEGGKYYAAGDACPPGLSPRLIQLLIRTRHLEDPEAKVSERKAQNK